jgi:hypothetical protein
LRILWILALLCVTAMGCSKQKYAECKAPNDHLTVMFKAKNAAHPFSHSFCIVCNTELESEDYAAWAQEMGAAEGPENTEGLLPCLYVYNGVTPNTNIDSMVLCKSLVCGGGADYNDMVSESNGNFNLDPIFEGTATQLNDEGMMLNDLGLQRSQPMDRMSEIHEF